jgi:hypothetical protein
MWLLLLLPPAMFIYTTAVNPHFLLLMFIGGFIIWFEFNTGDDDDWRDK